MNYCRSRKHLSLSKIKRMGSCLAKNQPDHVNSDEVRTQPKVYRKPRVLCLHGWRTNGDILSMQMAALQANVNIECTFIDAPFPGKGEPDKGIAFFYPDRPYYEWFYRNRRKEGIESKSSTVIYENLEESMKYLTDYLESNGPYDGLLGFSQGASMVTRLSKLQQETIKKEKNVMNSRIEFRFVILIGGVPPQELVDDSNLEISAKETLQIPSLHIMGDIDPLLPDSKILFDLYSTTSRNILMHEEGHNIPSIRTNLYPKINDFLDMQMRQT